MDEFLACGVCGSRHAASERFCPDCRVPLVQETHGTTPPPPGVSERHERARKVKRQYSDGRLVRVASAPHQAEAEMLAQMLLDEGVASVVRRSGGFDVPDFLAAGPRDIMVAESGADIARDVLGIEPVGRGPSAEGARAGAPLWVQALAVALIAVVIGALAAGVMLAVWG